MKRIAKLAQSVSAASPVVSTVRPLLRPAVLSPVRPLSAAGPSTQRYAACGPARRYATISAADDSAGASSAPLDSETIASDRMEDGLLGSQLVLGHGRRPLEIPEDVHIPPNVRFEGFENAEEPIPRGYRLHTPTTDQLLPIPHPLSSLAAANPTSPMTSSASPTSSIMLPPHVFAQPLRRDILHRCVVWYLALLRSGNQSTKSRSTVNYSGKKLRPQKGSGKARVGDASSGIRRGGAPIFALHPRDHTQLLPRKVRALGLASALSSKLSDGLLRIVPDLNEAEWSGTAEARRALCDGMVAEQDSAWAEVEIAESAEEPTSEAEIANTEAAAETETGFVRRFGTPSDLSILFVYPQPTSETDLTRLEQFVRAVRNLPGVEVLPMDEIEVYHVLKYKWCILERGVVDGIAGSASEDVGEDGIEELLLSDAEVESDAGRKTQLETAALGA